MTSSLQQPLGVDYFAEPTMLSENYGTTPPSFLWDIGLYDDAAMLHSPFHHSSDTSPDSQHSLPYSNDGCGFPSKKIYLDEEPAPSFIPMDFEDCLSWDDNALSLFVEPPYTAQDSRPVITDTRPCDLLVMPSMSSDTSDDSAAEYSDLENSPMAFESPVRGELLIRSPHMFPEVAEILLEDGLRSNPQSWERSQQSAPTAQPKPYPHLDEAEETRLLSIAMPIQPDLVSHVSSSFEPEDTHNRRIRRSPESSPSEGGASPRKDSPQKRKSHNKIEKRYRTNINDKIAALRNSIPSLRDSNSCDVDLQLGSHSLSSTRRLNKASILSNATEYIAYLEKRTQSLASENAILATRVGAFQTLFMDRSSSKSRAQRSQQNEGHPSR